MAKRRRYGDAWKDVQIDAEQNDAVFDRFFKRTQHDPGPPAAGEEVTPLAAGEGTILSARKNKVSRAPAARPHERPQPKATVSPITPALPNVSSGADTYARVDLIKLQYRLSKGEAAVLRCLLEKAAENGGSECYAKIPQLAETCEMTHRGCQFALRNLETRGFVLRLKDYDPANRRGIQFRITLPTA
jgi:predicted transcriptional regulator